MEFDYCESGHNGLFSAALQLALQPRGDAKSASLGTPGLSATARCCRRPLDPFRKRQGPLSGALRFVRVLGARVQAARDQRVVQAAERLPDEPQFFGREAWHA
jgi:hypothetical protein